jgi:plasmid stabilization system protein ParE
VRVFWTNRALHHLLLIREQVGQTSEVYAERVVERLVGRSEQLAAFPFSGRRVPEYERDDVREVIERPYRLIYRVREEQVDVLAAIHSRQQLPPEIEGL